MDVEHCFFGNWRALHGPDATETILNESLVSPDYVGLRALARHTVYRPLVFHLLPVGRLGLVLEDSHLLKVDIRA